MAAAAEAPLTPMALDSAKPLRVCFSYAAYAKNLLCYLKSANIPVEAGLTEAELSAVERSLNFNFPPDLRSILREGLPIGPGFPNWRSSSKQQLEILFKIPIRGICKKASRNEIWTSYWGERPVNGDAAARLVRNLLRNSPALVPIYRDFYIPAAPCAAGNPIFYVHGGVVKIWSFDIAGFFQRVEFDQRPRNLLAAPAWSATVARKVEFWTEAAEAEDNSSVRGLAGLLDDVSGMLRAGGWKEEDVCEMMNGCDAIDREERWGGGVADSDFVERRVRNMSVMLLRAGWSREDVVESLGLTVDHQGERWFDVHCKDRGEKN